MKKTMNPPFQMERTKTSALWESDSLVNLHVSILTDVDLKQALTAEAEHFSSRKA